MGESGNGDARCQPHQSASEALGRFSVDQGLRRRRGCFAREHARDQQEVVPCAPLETGLSAFKALELSSGGQALRRQRRGQVSK
jgi:hypothetical protein